MIKVAILGASYLQKPLVEKAKSMGVETHVFAWDNEDAVCKSVADYFYPISVLDRKEIYNICKELKINGITTIATDICIPTISYVAEKLNLISNSYSTSIKATNKAEMRKIFLEHHIKSPKYIVLSKNNSYDIDFTYPLIVKPTDRSGSRGVSKVIDKTKLDEAINRALSESIEKKIIIEEYIEGDCEVSVESISFKGQHFIIAITDKVTTGPPHFVELEHHQPSSLSLKIKNEIKKIVIKSLNALNIKYGASHIEFKITPKGEVFIIEAGARMGGDFIGSHLVKLSTGYDYLKEVIKVSLGEFEEPKNLTNNYAGVYFLSKETSYLIPFFLKDNFFDVEKEIKKNSLKNIQNSNDRSGYLIYKHTIKLKLN